MSFNLFEMGNNKLLPGLCKPYPDELLSSWMTRMAYRHGLTTKEMCKHIWPKYNGNPDIDRILSDNYIQTLAERTNRTYSEINATTMAFYKHKVFTKKNIAEEPENWIIRSRIIENRKGYKTHSSGLMYCPKCLESQPYFKKQWRLALSFACVSCGCYLIENCPHCGKGNSFIDTDQVKPADYTLLQHLVYCHHCGKDVRDCQPETAPDDIVWVQQRLFDVMDHGVNDRVIYTESYFRVLHYLASLLLLENQTDGKIRDFVEDVYRQNNILYSSLRPCKVEELRDLTVKKRAVIIMLAHWLLEDWPYRFLDLCLANGVTSRRILKGFKNAPYWFWETVQHGLIPSFPEKLDRFEINNDDTCTVKLKSEVLLRIDYDYDEYFYDDNKYMDDDFNKYTTQNGSDRLQHFYGITNKRRLRYLYDREERYQQ
jgi:hypothetical protein